LKAPAFARRLAGGVALAMTHACVVAQAAPELLARYTVIGDSIPAPLTRRPGDAESGRRIVADRQAGLCLLCHSGPLPEAHSQGNLATDLGGAGSRWSEGQLRLRLVDPQRVDPRSIMPAYHRIEGLTRVGSAWQGKPVLAAQQIEDVVAFLRTLRAAP
jgi:sulfur-oxidizing protein SoxX